MHLADVCNCAVISPEPLLEYFGAQGDPLKTQSSTEGSKTWSTSSNYAQHDPHIAAASIKLHAPVAQHTQTDQILSELASPTRNGRGKKTSQTRSQRTTSSSSSSTSTADNLPSSSALSSNTRPTSIAYNYPPPAPCYPILTPHLHKSPITIVSTPDKGRGVYATEDVKPGTVIDISPVLLLSCEEYYGGAQPGLGQGVEGSVLRGYVFTWKGKEGGMALALGLGSIFNHSRLPNISFELNTASYTITYKVSRTVNAGDELCIFYGHNTRFDGDPDELAYEISDEEDLTGWGGLGGIGLEENHVTRKQKKRYDEEIIPFSELEWEKVTTAIDPEDQPLQTTYTLLSAVESYALDIPARFAGLAFSFVRRHAARFDELSHLKRVRHNLPAELVDGSNKAERPISVLLFPVATTPPNLQELLDKSPLAFLSPKPFKTLVPTHVARTDEQAEEWSQLWPVQTVHIREGPKALPRAKGWERAKNAWIKREGERVWRAALEAQQRGEHPIACHVTDTFHPEVHSASSLPKTLVRAFDTRKSTRNILSHAASNAIDAVAILDRQNLRAAPLLPEQPAPYLLTGLTVFMSHEPCLLCAMSLLHSRIAHLFYIKTAPGSGGLGSLYSVHEDEGLNHRFEVWQWKGAQGIGEGLDVKVDT